MTDTFYCASPWRGLHIGPTGHVRTCCSGQAPLGNLNSQSITDILNGPALQQIRQSLKNGIVPDYCKLCADKEKINNASERAWHNTVNKDFDIAQASDQYEYPTLIDARWGSTCNLSCNYCDPSSSSKWATLVKWARPEPSARTYYDAVCDFVQANNQHIRMVALLGGEPMLLPENDRFLDTLPDKCKITVFTNLSIDLENNKIFQKLKERTNVGWSMSFDNIEDRFEYVRHGASWDKVLHNLDIMQTLFQTGRHYGGVHAVYNMFNATRLCEFREFLNQRGLAVVWQQLMYPPALNPRNHGKEVARLALDEINLLYDTCAIEQHERDYFDAAAVDYQLQLNSNASMTTELTTFISDIETKYHTNMQGKFVELWPEFNNLS
jgi:MoaA/NifB/PqqE/SkfB family radical SAM enzyme